MKILLLTYYSLGTAYHALNLFLHFSLSCSLPYPPPFSPVPISLLPRTRRIQGASGKVGIDSITCGGFFLGAIRSGSFCRSLMLGYILIINETLYLHCERKSHSKLVIKYDLSHAFTFFTQALFAKKSSKSSPMLRNSICSYVTIRYIH